MAKITKRIVDGLKPGDLVWDEEVKGFGVRCQKSAKAYVLKFRHGSRQRWVTIGKHGSPWSPKMARDEALRLLGMVAGGADPAKARDALKDRPTVKMLCDRFIEEYSVEHKKPLSQINDKANVTNHVVPILGQIYVADVTRADIDRFKRAVKDGKTAKNEMIGPRRRVIVRGGPGSANKCLALLSKMFNMAELWGWRPDGSNPCRHVEKYPGKTYERFLSEKELGGLSEVLTELERDGTDYSYAVAAIRLLIFTGARLGEILTLEWSHVDFDRAMLLLPNSKTGKKAVFLSAPALEILSAIPRMTNNPFVICGDVQGAHLVNLQKPWTRIRKKAGLENFRIHDHRHSFASVGAAGGLSLPMIGRLLGHTQPATTNRYAHLAADPVKAANEAIGERIAAIMKGNTSGADIVALRRNR